MCGMVAICDLIVKKMFNFKITFHNCRTGSEDEIWHMIIINFKSGELNFKLFTHVY